MDKKQNLTSFQELTTTELNQIRFYNICSG